MSEKVTCKTCPHLIHEDPFYWCGLERTEDGDVDVTFDWKPLEIQPPWCKLLQKAEYIDKMLAIDLWNKYHATISVDAIEYDKQLRQLPVADVVPAEPQEIGYDQCANAMLKMWIDNVVTDGEYNRIMDKLNKHYGKCDKDG